MINKKKITAIERDKIAIWLAGGVSLREIGKRLDRHHSSILREVKRNGFVGGEYVSIFAQARSEKRKSEAGYRPTLKNPDVFRYTIERMIRGWSPEQISGRLKRLHSNDKYWHICFETIYSFIYSKEQQHRKWWEYLPRKQKRRRVKCGRKSQKVHIPNRVSIHLRPKEVENREELGHWESDTVLGRRRGKSIHTEVERVSRITYGLLKQSTIAESTIKAQQKIFSKIPSVARKSTTMDNGHENVLHIKLQENLGMDTYFADPYSSYQRGTNEYHNGLIRRYLPKGTSFDNLTQKELNEIITEINNRPRKCLGFKTPYEVYSEKLKQAGGAIQLRM